ncbi:MAG: sterol desaturase family protein [Alphaproteobacteria bacterium]|nr:sterol desaturase family protein [Alphaproteobacteria bacterium]
MDSAAQALLTWKGVVVAAWLVLLFLAERAFPAAPAPTGAALSAASLGRNARNLGLWLANVALSPLVVLPLTAAAAGLAPQWRPGWWSGAPGLALDLLLFDFLIYWWHRANHVVPLLWRFHQVHHLDRFLDSTSALRFHFGEVLLSATARAAVVVALAFPLSSVLAFEGLLLLATIFHHSNLRLPAGLERALSRAIVTPSIHWVHHHRVRGDTDSNYASVLSLWDRLFASRSATARAPDMEIGVEGRKETGFLGLLLRPFRP